MITHVVLFRPRLALSADERRSLIEALRALAAGCPSIRACRVGRRVLHGLPGYEQAMREPFDYALLLEFDDLEGLRQYLQHPLHHDLGHFFTSGAAAALAYDFDLQDVEGMTLD